MLEDELSRLNKAVERGCEGEVGIAVELSRRGCPAICRDRTNHIITPP
jgi:hypothetical protein